MRIFKKYGKEKDMFRWKPDERMRSIEFLENFDSIINNDSKNSVWCMILNDTLKSLDYTSNRGNYLRIYPKRFKIKYKCCVCGNPGAPNRLEYDSRRFYLTSKKFGKHTKDLYKRSKICNSKECFINIIKSKVKFPKRYLRKNII